MKNGVNSLAIGMFVLGAALLAVVSVIVFGASTFFQDEEMFASKFAETVNGLDVGAPVKFKGVKIGKVERIAIASPRKSEHGGKDEDMVAVHYSIDMNLLKRRMRGSGAESSLAWIKTQIKDGLRARLMYQSVVTGMLYVELDYFAPADAQMKIMERGNFIDIPSESSNLSETVKAMQSAISEVAQIDFKSLFANASTLLANTNTLIVNLNQKISEIDTKQLNASAINTMAKTDKLLASANEVANTTNTFLKNTDANITSLSKDLKQSLENLDKVVADVRTITSPNSNLRYELATVLRSLNATMTSISNLTEYLQRNPNAILTGKSHFKLKGDK